MNLHTTIGRFLKSARSAHVLCAIVFALTLTLLITYQAYIVRQNHIVNMNLLQGLDENEIVLSTLDTAKIHELPPWRGNGEPPVLLSYVWRNETYATNLGVLPFSSVTYGEPQGLVAETISIPVQWTAELGLTVGDTLWIDGLGWKTISATHSDGLFSQRAVMLKSNTLPLTEVHVSFRVRESISLRDAVDYVSRHFAGSYVEYRGGQTALAKRIISGIYAPSLWSKLAFAIFIGAAYLTSTLYAFLGKRRPLAILKSLGLQTRELAYTIALESLVAPLSGLGFGFLAAWVLLAWLNGRGAGLPLSVGIVANPVIWILPAIFLGLAIPIRLISMGTVDQLLNERVIPLSKQRVQGLKKRYAALDTQIAKGVRFLELGRAGGTFRGFVFRNDRDFVKENEVLAYAEQYGGLVVTEYLAPTSGQIIWYQPYTTGLIGIAGKDYDWRYFGEYGPRTRG